MNYFRKFQIFAEKVLVKQFLKPCPIFAHGLLIGLSWDALGELYPQSHELTMNKGFVRPHLVPCIPDDIMRVVLLCLP